MNASHLRGRISRKGGSIDLRGPAYVIITALVIIAIITIAVLVPRWW
jgi:hypothetical protein